MGFILIWATVVFAKAQGIEVDVPWWIHLVAVISFINEG